MTSADDRPELTDGTIEVLEPEDLLGIGGGDDILVVDDTETNLIAIESALAPLGRKLVLAQSGVEALAKLLEQDFSLILLDVAMPGMSGFETARLIRSRPRSRGTPIIFVTGLSWQDEAILEGYEVGGFDFLIKPIRPEVLRAKARVFLQLQERTWELQRKVDELRQAQRMVHHQELAAQRQRYEAALLESRVSQLAEVDKHKNELLSILGHELRNPLQSLQMAVDILRQRPVPEIAERAHGVVERRVHHMSRLVDDLLDATRFAAGQVELRRELVRIGELVRHAIESCAPTITARKHTVRLLPERDDLGPTIMGDAVRIVQVVSNLIDNAAKYTAPGGTIDVSVIPGERSVTVRVADPGRGIAPDLLPRIFDTFVGKRASSDGSGGLGLGLGLVKRLVELHDGTVRASSAGVNQGSTFEIELPLTPSSP